MRPRNCLVSLGLLALLFATISADWKGLGTKNQVNCLGNCGSEAGRRLSHSVNRNGRGAETSLEEAEVVDKNNRTADDRGVKTIDPLMALLLALQVKILVALPMFLLAAGLISVKSLAAGLISVFFSGASLLRSLLSNNNNNNGRPGGASSRVAYEVRSPSPSQGAASLDYSTPYFYPPSAVGVAVQRQPDVRVISAASNN